MIMHDPHRHVWTVVQLGDTPIGASCECGASSGFEFPAEEVAVLEIGTVVSLGKAHGNHHLMVVENVRIDRDLTGVTASIELGSPERSQVQGIQSWNTPMPDPAMPAFERKPLVKMKVGDDPKTWTVARVTDHLHDHPEEALAVYRAECAEGGKQRKLVREACLTIFNSDLGRNIWNSNTARRQFQMPDGGLPGQVLIHDGGEMVWADLDS